MYVKQQQVKKYLTDAKVKCERNAFQSLRERGVIHIDSLEEVPDHENVEYLRVNEEHAKDEDKIRKFIKHFWEGFGGVGEASDVKEGCVTRKKGWG